jgi:DNA invertase Pin-like site-specific DNA recombinase
MLQAELAKIDTLQQSPRNGRRIVPAEIPAAAEFVMPHGRLMLTVLDGLAEFERELIVARISEGRARARERGIKLGPKHKLTPGQRAWVAAERARGESTRHLARVFSVSKATIARIPPAG